MKRIELEGYEIDIGEAGILLDDYLSDHPYSGICIIVDENTEKFCLPKIKSHLAHSHIIYTPSGESHKNIETCQKIWSQMRQAGTDRYGLVINLGGGVIGDMGGFCASCYMRGIDFIHVPTTLLSQVDASVGGKLGVDYEGYKNFIGLFNNPKRIIIDPSFLDTLPERELRSGFAEIIKHGLIRERQIWEKVCQTEDWKNIDWPADIAKSIVVKKEVVMEDPYEQGQRKILNFGHSIGHAIESASFNTARPLLHGEAIALGMICESFLSVTKTGLSQKALGEIVGFLTQVFSDIGASFLEDHDEIASRIKGDKKNKKGLYLFSLLKDIGDCTYDIPVSPEEITESLVFAAAQIN